MKKKWKFWAAMGFLAVLVIGCLVGYSDYIQRQIYYECTEHLLETYEQVDKTIMMFAQRNWNVLADWSSYLREVTDPDTQAVAWRDFDTEKKTWNYSDFYMLNEAGEYWTVDGRQGEGDHVRKAFRRLYQEDAPVVSSYTATSGVQKVVFAVPTEPIVLDGVTYTGLAVSYDSNVLENMIGGGAYNGQSDSYVIYPDGTVLMSTEPKTEIQQKIDNLFDYVRENATVSEASLEQARENVLQGGTGSMMFRYRGKKYYFVYQPSSLEGMMLVGIVNRGEAESGMRNVQAVTIWMLMVQTVCILIIVVLVMIEESERKLKREEEERKMLAHQKELASRLFHGISRVADRFCICDLAHDQFEYHERKGPPLYKETGSYAELVQYLNDQYVVLAEGEEVKFSQLLSPESIRSSLNDKDDMLRYEYCSRDKSAYLMLYIIPLTWEKGVLSRIMFITQDMGRQHELENLANTDSLTGLFNGRFFSRVLHIKEERQQPFVLFYLDLDRFKPINDTYGHDMGDKLLQEVSRRLLGCIRSSDYAFRIGGDEFALVANGSMDEPLRMARIEKIRSVVRAPIVIDGVILTVGTSCGCAVYPDESRSTEGIRVLADQRMYEDKEINHAGR